MSEDLDFDMEVVGDDELDDMGADGTSSSADDGTRSDRKTTGVEVSEHSRSDSNRGTGTDEGTALANREEKIFERGGDVEGWKEKTLGSIFDSIYSGGTPKKGVDEYYGGDLPFVKIEDLNRQQGKGISSAETHITEKAVEETSTRAFNVGTLLLTIYGSLAETALVRNRVATNQAILGLWDAEEENTLYVKYAIDYDQAKLQSLSRQTTQANLGKGIVAKHRLSVPPLPEQRKIASVLYAVDQAIQKTEAIIEQAKRVKRGLMQDLFTVGYYQHEDFQSVKVGAREKEIPVEWEVRTVGEISKVKTGHNFSSDIFGEYGIPLIKISNIKDGFVEEEKDQDYLLESDVPEQYVLHENEVLIALSGATTGKTGVIRSELCPAALNQRVASIETLSVVQDYLNQYLLRNEISKFIRANASASAQKNISKGFVESIKVPIPSKDEQLKIADTLNSVQSAISGEKQTVQRLERLKKGLMQDLLTGEVRTADKAIEVLGEVNAHG